ncbi:MAG: Flp pilus assembly protein CpaB [Planctomycetaceae bacterium]|jgi:pilus assembly protein CpaB|nr:Flp pilus assembly protein CpaB [Planctomycetaceae bacterium]
MRAKSLILFVIAIGCGLAASIGVSQYMENASAPGTELETEKILVAITDITIGETLDAQTVKLEEWPKDRVPEGAVLDFEEVEGKFSRTRMYAGEPILNAKVMDSNKGSKTVTIPKGYRAVAVKVSAETAGGGLIQPGDRVDVLVLLRKSQEVRETGARTILQDVNVFSVDGATERAVDADGQARSLNTVALLLKPRQVEAVMLASELGRLFLTVRRPDDDIDTEVGGGETVGGLLGYASESANEKKHPGGGDGDFSNWLNKVADTKPEPQTLTAVSTPAEQKPKWEMEILGPNGSRKFHWTAENELPVEGEFGATPAPKPFIGAPAPTPTLPLTAPQPRADQAPPSGPPAADQEDDVEEGGDQAVAPH